jgi:hypothetical protein
MGTFTLDTFKDPPKSARPMVRWWWTGVDVEKEELLREVQDLDEAGFLGGEIQASMIGAPSSLKRRDPDAYRRAHRFMQPIYYEMIQAVLDEAAQRGMTFDLTVCSAWPAGGVHVDLADSMRVLFMGSKVIRGGQRYTGRVPRFKTPFFYRVARGLKWLGVLDLQTLYADRMKLVRVVAVRPVGKPGRVRSFRPKTAYLDATSAIDLTSRVNEEGILEWNVPLGTWQLFGFYAGPSGTHPLMDAREDPNGSALVLDHLARKPIERHLEHHLGRARSYWSAHMGKTLRAFFTDSLELASEWSWTDDFLAEFEARRGYDLSPYLPVNYVPAWDNKYLSVLMEQRPCFDLEGDLGARIRHDFEQTVSDLFTERFAQAMTDWANANGMQSRIQAYGVRADTLKTYGIAHIPETEQLFAGGAMDFLRLAGSSGVIYDKALVTAESMVWNQRDYLTTPLKWKVAADRLFAAGINQMIYHGFPYQNPAYPYPGYDPFSSPYTLKAACFSSNFSRANPFWPFFPAMNAYITRCQHVLQQGKTCCSVGLFYPLFNYPDAVLTQEELIGGVLDESDAPMSKRAVGGVAKAKLDEEDKWTQAQIVLGDHLTSHGYNYVHINPEGLLGAQLQEGKLVLGAARLDVLILSQVERITVEVARKLHEIAQTGFPVVFVGRVPDKQPGFLNYRENDAIVLDLIAELAHRYDCVVYTYKGVASFLAEKLGIQPGIVFDQPQPTVHYIHKRMDQMDVYFLRHATREPIRFRAHFVHPERVPLWLDPWTGRATPAAAFGQDQDGIGMNLSLPPFGSCIVVFVAHDAVPHVVDGELQVLREDSALVAYTTVAGSYAFEMGDESHKVRVVAEDAPPALPLDTWRLETELRQPNGTLVPFSMDLQPTDWRDIPELVHCSSTGVYSAHVKLDERYFEEDLVIRLDLGTVFDAAVVTINGEQLAPLLVYPYLVEVTPYVHLGDNEITIAVTPTLRNRLIGYSKKGGKNWRHFKGRRALAPSGLVGPVQLISERRLVIVDEE